MVICQEQGTSLPGLSWKKDFKGMLLSVKVLMQRFFLLLISSFLRQIAMGFDVAKDEHFASCYSL